MARRYLGRHGGPRPASTARTGGHARRSGWHHLAPARQRRTLRVAVVLACAELVAGVLMSLPDATGTSSTSRFAAIADAYVSQAQPQRNFGSSPTLRTDAWRKTERSYLRFMLPDLGGGVTAATLRLYAETASEAGYAVHTLTAKGWTEDTITYADAPAPGSVVASSGRVPGDGWTGVDVTNLVGGTGVIDLVVTAAGNSAGRYASRESGATAPQLVVKMTTSTRASLAATSTARERSATTTARAGTTTSAAALATRKPPPRSSATPPPGGYFKLVPPGAWSWLPSGATCRGRIHASTWEPRPDNYKRNHLMPDPAAVHTALAARPRAVGGASDSRWDTWLLPRIDGQFTGTTDEIFQWAACKWGMPDDLLRAIAVNESTWYQYLTYPSGRAVPNYGSGDVFSAASADSKIYCGLVARFGYDYQQDLGSGICPQTFSIVGLKSWQDPAWGAWPDNQNGVFPFNRNSTAFAVDYLGSELRGCYEGWIFWLRGTGTGDYAVGDLWGCVGAWYAGAWHTSDAASYIFRVRRFLDARPWLDPGWPADKPSCSRRYGCPGPDPL